MEKCEKRGHRWIRNGDRTYICLDCGEPGFDVTDAAVRMPRWLGATTTGWQELTGEIKEEDHAQPEDA